MTPNRELAGRQVLVSACSRWKQIIMVLLSVVLSNGDRATGAIAVVVVFVAIDDEEDDDDRPAGVASQMDSHKLAIVVRPNDDIIPAVV